MQQRTRVLYIAIAITLLTLAVLILYGFSFNLSFFFDDMTHFRWLSSHSLGDVWSNAQTPGYYRPLPFTIWKILSLILTRYDAATFHAVNVVLHWLNALLVFALVQGRGKTEESGLVLGFISALLFLLYPFSYQAIPFVGSLTYPLVLGLMLGTILLYRIGQSHKPKLMLALSIVLALAAPLAHESGVLLPALLAIVLVTDADSLPIRWVLRKTWPYWICAAVGIALWFLVPKAAKPVNFFDLQRLWQNIIYMIQGLGYPVAPLANTIHKIPTQLSDLQSIAVAVLPLIFIWSLLLWKLGKRKLLALALGWFMIAVAPAVVFLNFDYIINGPRLLYSASVGAVLF
jgi:hypothetical protein